MSESTNNQALTAALEKLTEKQKDRLEGIARCATNYHLFRDKELSDKFEASITGYISALVDIGTLDMSYALAAEEYYKGMIRRVEMIENEHKYGCRAALEKLTEDQINSLEDYAYLMVINHERHKQERESEYRGALGGYLNGLRDAGVITQTDVNVLRIYFVDKAKEEVEELKKGGEL